MSSTFFYFILALYMIMVYTVYRQRWCYCIGDDKMLTFIEWLNQFDSRLCICGREAEDGYAHYLSEQLGRTPTITEVKSYGKITLLTTD